MDHDVRLIGYGIRLDPLRIDHAEALSALTDDGMWAGMTSARPRDAGEYSAHIAAQVRQADALAFAVVNDADGKVLGTTSLYDLSVGQGCRASPRSARKRSGRGRKSTTRHHALAEDLAVTVTVETCDDHDNNAHSPAAFAHFHHHPRTGRCSRQYAKCPRTRRRDGFNQRDY